MLIEHRNSRIGAIPGDRAPVFEAIRVHRPEPAPAEVPPRPPQEVPPPPPPGYLPDPEPTPPTPSEPPSRPVDARLAGGTVLVLTRRWS